MTNTKINQFMSRGSAAARALYTPDPPTPAGSDPSHGYFWYETDTGDTYAWDGSAWDKIAENPTNVLQGTVGVTDNALVRANGTGGSTAQGSAATMDDQGGLVLPASLKLTGVISPTQIVANTNDYAPTGFADALRLRLTTDAARDLTGLAGGADGRFLVIANVGGFSLTLKDESTSSTAANRFAMDGDLVLNADSSATLVYDGTASRWRVIGIGKATGGAGASVFTSLSDVPASYAGAALKVARVNSGATGLEFAVHGMEVIGTTTIGAPVAQIDWTNLSEYTEFLLVARGVTAASAGFRVLQASVDNGATFYSASGDYVSVAATGVETAGVALAGTSLASTAARTLIASVYGNKSGLTKVAYTPNVISVFVASSSVINALRFKDTAGNITAGTVTLLGRR